MARRRTKKRTHVGARDGGAPNTGKAIEREPKSMVIRMGAGEVGPSVTQLSKDMRQVMEPGTASKLKERRNNKLRDYTTMCGPLGVSHLILFSRSETGNTNMRIAITPRGPTLHFRVENYSLCKDILRQQKRPKNSKDLYETAPLLVMNNFSTQAAATENSDKPGVPKHLESLVTSIFQSIFPPVNPQNTPLSSIKRVLLLNREPPADPTNNAYTVSLRHYTIGSRLKGLTKPIKRINQAERGEKHERKGKGVPNLGRLGDVSEFLLGGENGTGDGNYTSASESDPDTDAEVEVLAPNTRKLLNRKERDKLRAAEENGTGTSKSSRLGVEKRAIKLTELGPRMRMRLVKVEEGLCGGKIMWHDYVAKTKAEQKEMEIRWEKRRQEKEERKRVQKENVAKKNASNKKVAKKDGEKDEDEDDEMEYDIEDDEYWHDDDGEGENGEFEDDEDEDMGEG